MPKRKTAEVNVDPAVSNEQNKRTPAKPKTPAATHKCASKKSLELNAVDAPVSAVAAPLPTIPSHEEIARLAYSYWEARGGQGGCPQEDWFRAEQQLSARR